jgi:hypothetical protein
LNKIVAEEIDRRPVRLDVAEWMRQHDLVGHRAADDAGDDDEMNSPQPSRTRRCLLLRLNGLPLIELRAHLAGWLNGGGKGKAATQAPSKAANDLEWRRRG